LRPESKLKSRYFPLDNRLARYSAFIVDPVELYLDDEKRAYLGRDTDLEKLSEYMGETLIKTLEGSYRVTDVAPGPGVGRIRVAITHLKKGAPFTIGGAAIEAELLDSQTGEQVVALFEVQQVRRRKGGGLSQWDDAKRIMDDWAQRFHDALEAAHAQE
jgi:hypothetical protein